jgi:hypothetical protein
MPFIQVGPEAKRNPTRENIVFTNAGLRVQPVWIDYRNNL